MQHQAVNGGPITTHTKWSFGLQEPNINKYLKCAVLTGETSRLIVPTTVADSYVHCPHEAIHSGLNGPGRLVFQDTCSSQVLPCDKTVIKSAFRFFLKIVMMSYDGQMYPNTKSNNNPYCSLKIRTK